MKSYLAINNSKVSEATSTVEDVKASEHGSETEKCVIMYWFADNAVFAVSNSSLSYFSILLFFPAYWSFYLYTLFWFIVCFKIDCTKRDSGFLVLR